jgi:hypothetical protein
MLDIYLDIAENLLSYKEFWGLLHLLQALLWLLILLVIAVVVMHFMYILGRETPLYRKRTPKARWNKQFFRASGLVLALILGVLLGTEWITENVKPSGQQRTIFTEFFKEIRF